MDDDAVVDARGKPVFVLGFDLKPRPQGAMPDGAPRFAAQQPYSSRDRPAARP